MMMTMRAVVVSRSVAGGAPLIKAQQHRKKCGGVGRGRRQQFALCRFRWSSSNGGTTGRWSGRDDRRRRGTRSALRGGTLFASEEEEEEEEHKKTDDDTDDDETKTDFIRAAASLQFGSAAAEWSGKDDDVNDDEKSKKRRSKGGGGVAPGLYVVSTPIGNLEDITIRGLKILTEASVLLCEDTRKTRHLLTLLGVQSRGKRFLAYHSHNFYEQREQLRDRILENKDEEVIALVSDAGAPGVSDPGQDLVDLVLEATSTSGGGGDKEVTDDAGHHTSKAGATLPLIIGGAVAGGILLITAAVTVGILLYRRHKARALTSDPDGDFGISMPRSGGKTYDQLDDGLVL